MTFIMIESVYVTHRIAGIFRGLMFVVFAD